MKTKRLIIVFFMLACSKAYTQNVSINNDASAPHPSAMLDVSSTSKGFLMPRMTTAQRNAIVNPALGLIVYQTDGAVGVYQFNGSAWNVLGSGNTILNGTTSPTIATGIVGDFFINTVTNQIFGPKTASGWGTGVSLVGPQGAMGPPGPAGTSGWALTGNAGTNPATNFIGTTDDQPLIFKINNVQAGKITNVGGNLFFGYQSGTGNTGSQNTGIGFNTLYSNAGAGNTASGFSSLYSNLSGFGNSAFGVSALAQNTSGYGNSSHGREALYNNSTGFNNTAIGGGSLSINQTGSYNTAIGSGADVLTESLVNATAIGAKTRVDCSNCLVLGSVNGINTATSNVNVGIGTTLPNPSAVLDLTSANKGMLMPRVALTGNNDVTTIVSPATSLLVYNTATVGGANAVNPGYYYWSAPLWRQFATSSSSWSLTGNAGTNPALNFIGTTDDQPLIFKVNNVQAGMITRFAQNLFFGYEAGLANSSILSTGMNNTAAGFQAFFTNTWGFDNTAIGSKALYANTYGILNTAHGSNALNANSTGGFNTANGASSLKNNLGGVGNTATGTYAMLLNISGNDNTAHGKSSLYSNTSGNNNTANGSLALYSNTTGFSNVAVGVGSLYKNVAGSNLVAIGDSALYNTEGNNLSGSGTGNTAIGSKALYTNLNGSANTANGYSSLYSNLSGSSNTANGVNALLNNTTGWDNTAIGVSALYNNQTGSLNTAIGSQANVSSNNLFNATAIGANAIVGASNSLVLGGIGANAVKVGIGVTSPIVTLHVKGTANIFSGADTHTGDFYAGTSNFDGIEMVSTGTDAYGSIQRTSNYGLHISKKNVSTNTGLVGFFVNGVNVGSINTTGLATAYNTTSDMRLKENIMSTAFGLNALMKINVADYNYISDSKKGLQTGFVAQELFKIYPQAVQAGGEDAKTNPWMIDYSKLTPLLVKSIQEQQTQIETQNKRINEQELQINIMKDQIEALVKKSQEVLKN